MTELKPCPFCGAEGNELTIRGADGHRQVVCTKCLASGPLVKGTVDESLEAWNERVEK